MKIKDLDGKTNLEGLKVKTPSNTIGYWKGQWSKGIWLSSSSNSMKVTPYFVDDIKEVLEWEVLKED